MSRCNLFLKKMIPSSLSVFFSSPIYFRSNDCEYPYRQQSDFFYLTGINESSCILIIIKYDAKFNSTLLFSNSKKIQKKFVHFEYLLSIDTFNEQLYNLAQKISVIYHAENMFNYADKIIFYVLNKTKKNYKIINWQPILHEMRLFKSIEEINIIKKSCQICSDAHIRAMKFCLPGMYEYQLSAEIEHEFAFRGVKSPAFNTIVGSGNNSCTLHYTEKTSLMNSGDLVLIDAGAEYQGYVSDISCTFPVNGKFSQPQVEIYNIVLSALNTALLLYRPGISIYEVTIKILKIKILGLIKLGILKGNLKDLLKNKSYLPFFMHNLSHWIGLDVHDVGNYGVLYNRKLKPGMVISVEPGIYIDKSYNNVPEKYKGIGIRIEDNILITLEGNENLTSSIIRDPKQIEKNMLKI